MDKKERPRNNKRRRSQHQSKNNDRKGQLPLFLFYKTGGDKKDKAIWISFLKTLIAYKFFGININYSKNLSLLTKV